MKRRLSLACSIVFASVVGAGGTSGARLRRRRRRRRGDDVRPARPRRRVRGAAVLRSRHEGRGARPVRVVRGRRDESRLAGVPRPRRHLGGLVEDPALRAAARHRRDDPDAPGQEREAAARVRAEHGPQGGRGRRSGQDHRRALLRGVRAPGGAVRRRFVRVGRAAADAQGRCRRAPGQRRERVRSRQASVPPPALRLPAPSTPVLSRRLERGGFVSRQAATGAGRPVRQPEVARPLLPGGRAEPRRRAGEGEPLAGPDPFRLGVPGAFRGPRFSTDGAERLEGDPGAGPVGQGEDRAVAPGGPQARRGGGGARDRRPRSPLEAGGAAGRSRAQQGRVPGKRGQPRRGRGAGGSARRQADDRSALAVRPGRRPRRRPDGRSEGRPASPRAGDEGASRDAGRDPGLGQPGARAGARLEGPGQEGGGGACRRDGECRRRLFPARQRGLGRSPGARGILQGEAGCASRRGCSDRKSARPNGRTPSSSRR